MSLGAFICHHKSLQIVLKGTVFRIWGDLGTEIEYDTHNYVFISV